MRRHVHEYNVQFEIKIKKYCLWTVTERWSTSSITYGNYGTLLECKAVVVSGQSLRTTYNQLQYLTTVQAYQPYHLFIKGSISMGPFQVNYLKTNVACFRGISLLKWSLTEV